MKFFWLTRMVLATIGLLLTTQVMAQPAAEFLNVEPTGSLGEGWKGFTDLYFLFNALMTLTLATVLGAIIAYHPKHEQTADTQAEVEAPKVYMLYAVIGALIGIMVVKYGLVVGFVLFGIGGLIRFRTLLGSARLTGQVILVTLIGLSCGLDLPHVAVLATAFGFGLIFLLDARIIYRIDIKALPADRVSEAAAAYRALIEAQGCRIMNEKKDPGKKRITFIFQSAGNIKRPELENRLETEIEEGLRGSLDWEVD